MKNYLDFQVISGMTMMCSSARWVQTFTLQDWVRETERESGVTCHICIVDCHNNRDPTDEQQTIFF